MLTLYANNSTIPLQIDDYYVKHLASGLDELVFQISIWDENYQKIQEESSIRESSGTPINYLVKAIDAGKETATVKCQIDLDEWKSTITIGYDSGSNSCAGIIRSVCPSGWTVVDPTSLTYLRTIHLDSATPYDVLQQCRSTFSGVTYRFDNVQKTITLIDMNDSENIGAFVTRELNLKQNNYKGKSTGFITRLYAYGKNNLTFASINDGKEYVDNNTYSNRIICGYWKDERYTVAENLKAAAEERLKGLALPQRSYDCDVVDLAATDPTKYGFLDFQLFTIVTLIDDTRSNTKIDHQVVELWEYPYLPHKNKVVLSTVAPKIFSQITQIVQSLTDPNSDFSQSQATAIERATAYITGQNGGYIRNIYNNDIWAEQVIMDTDDITTATKVWRWNLGGLGYSPNGYNGAYTTAITQGGEIVADFITAGTLDASKITVTNLDASAITTGTLDASDITVTNLNAASITAGYISAARIEDRSLAGTKIQVGGITGGASGELALSTVTGGNIGRNTISGGSSGNLGLATIDTNNTIAGINTSLGYADFSNMVFDHGTTAQYIYATLGSITTLTSTTTTVSNRLNYLGSRVISSSGSFVTGGSVGLNVTSTFKVHDINGNEQWVTNIGSASFSPSTTSIYYLYLGT